MNFKFFKITKKESGQSMVELAVSFVVLMVLLAGVVELGRMSFHYIAMRDAAQEGASYASIFPNNNYEIFERVKAGLVDQGRLEIFIEFKTPADVLIYECNNKPDGGGNIDNCTFDIDTSNENNVKVNDKIEIIVRDPQFPVSMPFFSHEIVLETKISDFIISVPSEEEED